MPNNPDCLAIRIASQGFQINHGVKTVQEQGKSVDLRPITPEMCAGCDGSDPAVNEAMVQADVAPEDGLLKVAVTTITGSCPQATG